jgi:hypothetical protein
LNEVRRAGNRSIKHDGSNALIGQIITARLKMGGILQVIFPTNGSASWLNFITNDREAENDNDIYLSPVMVIFKMGSLFD